MYELAGTVDLPLCCVKSIEEDSEGIPGWKNHLERLCVCVYSDELKKEVYPQNMLKFWMNQ